MDWAEASDELWIRGQPFCEPSVYVGIGKGHDTIDHYPQSTGSTPAKNKYKVK